MTEKQPDKRIRVLLAALIFAAVHFAGAAYFVFAGYYREGDPIPVALRIVGFAWIALELALMIFARLKKYSVLLSGLLAYKAVGVFLFAAAWMAKIVGGAEAGQGLARAFSYFSVFERPLSYVLSPVIGMSEIYKNAILFGLAAYFAALGVSGIRKQVKYEKQLAEKMELARRGESVDGGDPNSR